MISLSKRGCSSMVEHQPSKLDTWVRFPSPAFFMPKMKSHFGKVFPNSKNYIPFRICVPKNEFCYLNQNV